MKSSNYRYSRLFTLALLSGAVCVTACDGKDKSAGNGIDRPSPGQPNEATGTTGTSAGEKSSVPDNSTNKPENKSSGSSTDSTGQTSSTTSTTATTSTTTSSSSTTSTSSSSGTSSTKTGTEPKPEPATWKGDDFEANVGKWVLDKDGVWGIGKSTSALGPAAHGGGKVVGTVLDGDYPGGEKTAVLKSPHFMIPKGESARVRYWQWYNLGELDVGRVELRVDGVLPGQEPRDIGLDGKARFQHSVAGSSGGHWSQVIVDLPSKYEGRRAQLIFKLLGRSDERRAGWFMDDFSLETGAMDKVDQDFENGWKDWSVQGGLWSVGQSLASEGPKAVSGKNVAGTVLFGRYPADREMSTRLLSPRIAVAKDAKDAEVTFQQWFDLAPNDTGEVQVRVDYGRWETLRRTRIFGDSDGKWEKETIDLTQFAGREVQFGFRLRVRDNSPGSLGWYLDDFKVKLK